MRVAHGEIKIKESKRRRYIIRLNEEDKNLLTQLKEEVPYRPSDIVSEALKVYKWYLFWESKNQQEQTRKP